MYENTVEMTLNSSNEEDKNDDFRKTTTKKQTIIRFSDCSSNGMSIDDVFKEEKSPSLDINPI